VWRGLLRLQAMAEGYLLAMRQSEIKEVHRDPQS
jgi:hypothetical protein